VEILRERLSKRKTEDAATIARRMERVPMEMEKGREFDHQIVNDDLDRAIAEADALVETYLRN
jgi:guanylate kinase